MEGNARPPSVKDVNTATTCMYMHFEVGQVALLPLELHFQAALQVLADRRQKRYATRAPKKFSKLTVHCGQSIAPRDTSNFQSVLAAPSHINGTANHVSINTECAQQRAVQAGLPEVSQSIPPTGDMSFNNQFQLRRRRRRRSS